MIKERNTSIILSSQNIKLLLYPVISSRRNLNSTTFKHDFITSIKVDGVKIENLIREFQELKSSKEELT